MKPYYHCEKYGQTIYLGDCRDILPLLDPVDLVFTSPPYENQRNYGQKEGAFIWSEVVPVALGLVKITDCGQVLVNLGLIHKNGQVLTYWDSMIAEMKNKGFLFFGWYVWDQGFGLPGDWNGRFAPSHEFIFHFNKSAVKPIKFVKNKSFGRKVSGGTIRNKEGKSKTINDLGQEIQPFKIPDSVVRITREMRREIKSHPAIFPVEFASFMVSCWPGVILDPFMGSGTVLRAAKDLGRKAIGIEIEEKYCEIASRRLDQGVLDFK